MTPGKLPRALLYWLLWAVLVEFAHAQTVFTWTGGGTAGVISDSNNWLGGLVPTGTGSVLENATFGNATGSAQTIVVPSTGLVLHDLNFTGASRPAYTFSGTSSPTFTITGDVTADAGGNILLDSSLSVALATDLVDNAHTISVNDANLTINVQGNISGSGASIAKSGSGTLNLSGNNTFDGGLTLSGGILAAGSDNALGTGTLTVSGGTELRPSNSGGVTLGNAITLSSGLVQNNDAANSYNLTLNGQITGSGGFDWRTNGILTFTNATSDFTGGVYMHAGTLNLGASSTGTGGSPTAGPIGTGTLWLYNGSTLTLFDEYNFTLHNNITLDTTAGTTYVDVPTYSTLTLSGVISGTSNLTKTGYGELILANANIFGGGFTLNAGTLRLGSSTTGSVTSGPVGTGTLTINNGATLSTSMPTTNVSGITLANAISLPGSSSHVRIVLDQQHYSGIGSIYLNDSLTLSGQIAGPGAIDLYGGASVNGSFSLSGDNSSWTGGLNIYGNNGVWFGHNNALPGPLWFSSSSTSNVEFATTAPTIGSLSSAGSSSSVQIENTGATLTINQTQNGTFGGALTGSGNLAKSGSGTLTLTNAGNNYSGTTTINAGTLLVSGSLGAAQVTVNSGGTLGLAGDTSIFNPVTLNSGSKLLGQGYLNNIAIGTGVTLSPGFDGFNGGRVGELHFEDLTLGQGGILELDIKWDGVSFYYDKVTVQNSQTLTIAANSTAPFTLKLTSLNSDNLPGTLTSGLTAGATYSIPFLNTNGVSGSFTVGDNLVLDTSSFLSGFPTTTFSLTQSGNNFALNFTPVPEPSTYALLGLGLLLIVLCVRRSVRSPRRSA